MILRVAFTLTCVVLIGLCGELAAQAPEELAPSQVDDPADSQGSSESQSEDLPPSVERLFGESVPFPDPEETGLELYALASHDFFVNTTGGARKGGGVIANLFLSLSVDTEKTGLWNGGKFVFEGIGIYGRQPSKVVGDYQFSSCIDAPDTIEPYELFYEHSLFDDRLTWMAGIHDYSLDFAVANYGWDFVHSAFWTPSTMTQFWWSFYPSTGLGTRAKLKLSDSAYLMAGVYDGNPTNQENYREIDWGLSKRDGAHSLYELGLAEEGEGKRPFKLALGGWYNSGEFDSSEGGTMKYNYGGYAVGQTLLYSEDDSYERGLGGFFQVGQADNSRNFNTWYFGAGLRYKGLFPSRPEDILAVGWGRAEIGKTYRSVNPGTDSFEGNAEATYRAVINSWLTLQPSVQLISNPGANSAYNDSVILYLRTEIVL